jgi:hypothetical protein
MCLSFQSDNHHIASTMDSESGTRRRSTTKLPPPDNDDFAEVLRRFEIARTFATRPGGSKFNAGTFARDQSEHYNIFGIKKYPVNK